jgi:hypothetical protein
MKEEQSTPQGSPLSVIMWRFFFDSPGLNQTSTFLFMEDRSKIISGTIANDLQNKLQAAVQELWEWSKKNKVKFCPKKSVWMAVNQQSQGLPIKCSSSL